MKWKRNELGDYHSDNGRFEIVQETAYRRLGVPQYGLYDDHGDRIGEYYYLSEAKLAAENCMEVQR